MNWRARKGFRSLMVLSHTIACIVSMVMLISFPTVRVHSFADHFRPPEIRRTTQRQTYVAAESHHVQENVVRSDVRPKFFAPVETPCSLAGDRGFESTSEIPLVRLLHRLKLNPSGLSGQDPLLKA
jgi:hypothetical protein